MSEERVSYTVLNAPSSAWVDLRFDDGEHTGVRVLRGTTIIEVQRHRRKKLVDIAECKAIDVCGMMVDK